MIYHPHHRIPEPSAKTNNTQLLHNVLSPRRKRRNRYRQGLGEEDVPHSKSSNNRNVLMSDVDGNGIYIKMNHKYTYGSRHYIEYHNLSCRHFAEKMQ